MLESDRARDDRSGDEHDRPRRTSCPPPGEPAPYVAQQGVRGDRRRLGAEPVAQSCLEVRHDPTPSDPSSRMHSVAIALLAWRLTVPTEQPISSAV